MDLDGGQGQGQWSKHHGTGGCSVACTVHPALVCVARNCLVGGGGGGPRGPPHRRSPPLHAHIGGGGGPASVCWWDHGQCQGSNVWHAVAPKLGQRGQEVEDRGADGNHKGHGSPRTIRRGKRQKEASKEGSGQLMGKGDARAMEGRRTGDVRRTPRPNPCSHRDQEVTWGGKGGGTLTKMRLCSLTN